MRRPFSSDPASYEDEAGGWESAVEGGLPHDRRFVRSVLGDAACDGRLLVARLHGCDDWDAFVAHVGSVPDYDPFVRANAAIDAVAPDALVRALAAEPAIVREAGSWGDSLLQRALWKTDHGDWSLLPGPADDADGKRFALVEALIDAGSDVNQTNHRGWTPLHTAAYVAHLPALELLLGKGASVHPSTYGDGGTPLAMALFWGHVEAAERLAREEVVPLNLRVAAGLGRLGLIERLGVDGQRRDFYRPHEGFPFFPISDDPQQVLDEALVYACKSGRFAVLDRLLDWGADVNGDVAGTTPLATAATYGRTDCLRWLLGLGANVAATDSWGATALHRAVWFDRLDAARLLLERGAPVDVRDRQHDGTPLGWARHGGRARLVELLGAHDVLGLADAASVGRIDRIAHLLDADPDAVRAADREGDTALHLAAWYGRAAAVDLLLDRGADPAQTNENGRTALDLARAQGHADVVERLTGRIGPKG